MRQVTHIWVSSLSSRKTQNMLVCALHLGNRLTAHLGSSTVQLVSKKEFTLRRSSRNTKESTEIIACDDLSIYFPSNEVGEIFLTSMWTSQLSREDFPLGFGIIEQWSVYIRKCQGCWIYTSESVGEWVLSLLNIFIYLPTNYSIKNCNF